VEGSYKFMLFETIHLLPNASSSTKSQEHGDRLTVSSCQYFHRQCTYLLCRQSWYVWHWFGTNEFVIF